MRFWDTSAILPLISQEPLSEEVRRLLEEGAGMVVWWATRVECVSAISRRVREGSFDPGQEALARGLLDDLSESWTEVRPASRLRVLAEQTLTTHSMQAALQALRPCRRCTKSGFAPKVGVGHYKW